MGRRWPFPEATPQIVLAVFVLHSTVSGLPSARDSNEKPIEDVTREGDLKKKWSFGVKVLFF